MDLLKLTKKEIVELAIVEGLETVESGQEDILNKYLEAMAQAEYYTNLAKAYHDAALEEFELIGEKNYDLFGRKISKAETGVKYDFTNCGHVELEALERVKKDVESNIKGFKDQIKHIKESQTMVSEEGEVFTVTPPQKTSTTKLKLTY